MTGAAFGQRMRVHKVQKPALVKTSPTNVLGALCLVACGTSPIAAVVEDERPASGSAGSVNGTVACDEPLAGRFILSGETGCLRRGEATTVFGNPAFTTELSADCSTARAQWDLTPALAGSFTLRNVDTQLSLDVRTAADAPGTPIVLYEPTTFDNQRFWLRERTSNRFELAPLHAPSLCAEARSGAVEIWPCDEAEPGQVFRFARLSCP
ncbi:MAG TPA: RICIN domain-containing protein [Polyangiaceae bacterium]|nr:RICIN domain-containing protein [Polyangiaceae bacterium]